MHPIEPTEETQKGGAAAWAVITMAVFGCFISGLLIGLLAK